MEHGIDDSTLMLGPYILCNVRRHNDTQVPARHFFEENDVDRPAVLGGNRRSEVSVEPRHLRSLKGPEPPIRLHFARDAEVTQEEGVIYLRHRQRRVCGVCCRSRSCMRAAAMNAGGPDVGDAAHAGVKSLFEGNGHGWQSGGESDTLGDRFIVTLAELGGGGRAVVNSDCAGRRGGAVARR